MTEKTVSVETGHIFLNSVEAAFYLGNEGVGPFTWVVARYCSKKEDPLTWPYWARNTLEQGISRSSFVGVSYVEKWRGEDTGEIPPKNLSPLSAEHLVLLKTAEFEFESINRRALRFVLQGEDDLLGIGNDTPITREELRLFFPKGKELGLIEAENSINLSDTEKYKDIYFLYRELRKKEIHFTEKFNEKFCQVIFSEQFRIWLEPAVIHTLGAMLAILDQLFYDAWKSGTPISASFRPTRAGNILAENWEKMLGEKMPDIEGLFRKAYAVFVSAAEPNDPLVKHLFGQDSTKYLLK